MFAFIYIKTNDAGLKKSMLLILNLFLFLYFILPATLAHGQQTFPARYLSAGVGFDHFTTNKIVVKNYIGKETPVAVAYCVLGKEHEYALTDDEIHKLDWRPYKPELLVDLGAGAGKRYVWVVAKWENPTEYQQDGLDIIVDTEMPYVVITNPTNRITFQSLLRLQGYSSGYMMNPEYDISNAEGTKLNQDAYGTDHTDNWAKDYFEALDIALAPGTNIITFHCEIAGNRVSTNIVLVFTTVGDTNPPDFKLRWPPDINIISGSQFDMDGTCDDPSAQVAALVCDDQGNVTRRDGSVGRNSLGQDGFFIVERVPLSAGIEYITVIANDAAGNSSFTNITVGKSGFVMYMDRVANPQELWHSRISKVTGYYSRTNHPVSVNGVKAKMKPDGHWEAENVPNDIAFSHFEITADDAHEKLTPSYVWPTAILGGPTNGLQAGISFVHVSTNEYNHYPICLVATNISGTNQPRSWMLPTFDRRFALRLLDQSGKSVAKTEYFQKSGLVLPDNLNIHHLGKDELTNIDGIIPLSTNMAVQLASIKLDEHFPMPAPGNYRLEAEERLFQIADDGRLVPITLPSLMTDLKVINQPSELVFYLNDLERQGKLVWGAERYGLRIGVTHGLNTRTVTDANQIQVFIQNTSTNDYRNGILRFPFPNEQFDVMLYDASGKEVPKTSMGKQQGQPLSLDGQDPRKPNGLMDEIFGGRNYRHGQRLRPVYVSAKDATDCGRFNLADYFEIKTPGQYRLIYQQRFYRWNTNSILTGVIMPAVNVPLNVSYVQNP